MILLILSTIVIFSNDKNNTYTMFIIMSATSKIILSYISLHSYVCVCVYKTCIHKQTHTYPHNPHTCMARVRIIVYEMKENVKKNNRTLFSSIPIGC